MFGMGSLELVVIMIIAFVVLGPDRLAEVAGQAGKAVRDFRRMSREMTAEFEQPIADVRGAMRDMQATAADLQRETREAAASMTDAVNAPLAATPPRQPVAAPTPTRSDPLADLTDLETL